MRRGGVCIRLGLVLIALALGLWGWNLWENHQADTASTQVVQALTAAQPELPPVQPTQPEYVQFPQREMPEQELNGQRYVATLEIPKLGLTLPVISQCTPRASLSGTTRTPPRSSTPSPTPTSPRTRGNCPRPGSCGGPSRCC